MGVDDAGPWAIREQPITIPDEVACSDPVTAYRGLLVARGELETRRASETRTAEANLRTFLTDVVGVLDALDRSLGSLSEPDGRTTSSIRSTRRRLARVLRRQGVEQVEQAGKPLDPDVSDVEDVENHPELPAETVVRETVAAYTWHGVVLRRGSVVVSAGSAGAQRSTSAPGT